jgi:hypothetical protein
MNCPDNSEPAIISIRIGGTYDDGCELHVCTCKPDCPSSCKGECGCHACAQRYSDWLGDSFRDG